MRVAPAELVSPEEGRAASPTVESRAESRASPTEGRAEGRAASPTVESRASSGAEQPDTPVASAVESVAVMVSDEEVARRARAR